MLIADPSLDTIGSAGRTETKSKPSSPPASWPFGMVRWSGMAE